MVCNILTKQVKEYMETKTLRKNNCKVDILTRRCSGISFVFHK